MLTKIKAHHILFAIAILGLALYATAPLLFPDAPGLRQPELLPVYTAMLGIGQIAKAHVMNNIGGAKKSEPKKDETDVSKT